jgi:hypothetical protein
MVLKLSANDRNNNRNTLSVPHLNSTLVAFSLGLAISFVLCTVQDPYALSGASNDKRNDDAPRGVVTTHSSNNDFEGFACKGFFTIMVSAFIPSDTKPGVCKGLYNGRYIPLLEDHSRHFLRMNTTLTVFTTWTDEQLADPGCHLNDLPGLRVQ